MRRERALRLAMACAVAAAVLMIDQVTKALAVAQLTGAERIPLLGDLLGLQLAYNPGAVLSLGASQTWLITLIGVGFTVVVCAALLRARTTGRALGLAFILGGAFGNLVDRLFAPPSFGRGHVIDFLAYCDLFIGNLADVALGIGGAVLVLDLLRKSSRTRRAAPARRPGLPIRPATRNGES
ncbi:hypothetical protein GCM10022219_20520 [Microbacterium oryzae]|uniref:Lipoprotein signal peptidase n=1 Tax=Microbacterium oryzae TaxID=743009 RepID=A0A6I6E172_9MICO|nr:signal peptidase II [Microbacterium oryzae]QGU27699.1 signal peptidase II [Microbacterium oryzae]